MTPDRPASAQRADLDDLPRVLPSSSRALQRERSDPHRKQKVAAAQPFVVRIHAAFPLLSKQQITGHPR